MAEDTRVSNYRAAYTAALYASDKLEALAKFISAVAPRFANDAWKRVQVAPSSIGALSLKGWPSGDDLHEVIRDFNDKRERAREAWKEVPPEEQKSLANPSTLS